MKIVFLPGSMLPVHGFTLDERPLGGMETALIRLAEALQNLGHEVYVFTNIDNPPLSRTIFLPLSSFPHIGPIDVFIAIREWLPIFAAQEAKLRFFWTGDSYDLPQNSGIGDKRVQERLDGILCVSNWHAKTLCEHSGFSVNKAFILRNGINSSFFEGHENRKRKRLIYSSTPYRGLKFMPHIFSALKKKHAELELHIFSDYKVYSEDGKKFAESALKELADLRLQFSAIEGCFMHGNVTQKELAREMMKSSILTYPNSFEETSCITVMEAQAAGCPVVTSQLGALPETVGEAGIIVPGAPGSEEYINQFIKSIDKLLSDDNYWNKLSEKALLKTKDNSWGKIAAEFAEFLKEKIR